MIGTLIAVLAWALAIWLVLFRVGGKSQDDERLDVIERRIREVNPLPPDHPGEIVPFKRRAS